MGRVAEDLQPEIDRLRPSPRRDTWLAFSQMGEAFHGYDQQRHDLGLLKAYNAGNEFLDPATADFPDGADRPIHEGATRHFARWLNANSYGMLSLDVEEWFPPYPTKWDAAWGQYPIPDARLFIPKTIQLIQWVRSECPGLMILVYYKPPAVYWHFDDTPAERTQIATYSADLDEIVRLADGLNIDGYNTDAPGKDLFWRQYMPARIAQAKIYRKLVIVDLSPHPANTAPEDVTIPLRNPANLAGEIRFTREHGADGACVWGDGRRVYASQPHVDAIRAAVN